MPVNRLTRVLSLIIIFSLLITPLAFAQGPRITDGPTSNAPTSHRLIVELTSPPLASWPSATMRAVDGNNVLDVESSTARAYLAKLEAEQAAFVTAMQSALPQATVSTFTNEFGMAEANSYKVIFNGMAIDPGSADKNQAIKALSKISGVKHVYLDYMHTPTLYTSTTLINAPAIWNSVGGQANGGAGVKFASVDGGIHNDAPMFSGAGYSYPSDFPANGKGLIANNNGKIIASRAYFRDWDPPAAGDENPWPGVNGTSHGVHTSSTAAGNPVNNVDYAGYNVGSMSGVAPKAWVMSYRVFYPSNNPLFSDNAFSAELIAATEDAVADGADVINNSWGAGPVSVGGIYDPLDTALANAVAAGVFVSMSAGNAGPGNGTVDHTADAYISVAASSTSGTLASGVVGVQGEPDLQDLSFTTADFGEALPIGEVITYTFIAAIDVEPANFEGCSPFTYDFAGNAALISRGTCEFGEKVLNAENAGASFVIIYNHASGGDALINMGAGAVGNQVTIPSIFIGHTDGVAMVDMSGGVVELNTIAFQAGNRPDVITSFSSRGPGMGNVLKPDIAAPGENILAQGYAPGATGEARHLGYGQASGTSMASPHVAGAAALLTQVHPDWSPAYIKSALMSTAKYMNIFDYNGSAAQPLTMGAGRLDLTHAADPGVILDPPSLSFGQVTTGTTYTIDVLVTSVADTAETYNLSTFALTNQGAFSPTQKVDADWLSVSPASISLDPGETAVVTVMVDPAAADMDDNQGFVGMAGTSHNAHMPAWARVVPTAPAADVLIIDNDASYTLDATDYVSYYTDVLDELGYTYEVWDADENYGGTTTIPNGATLAQYRAVIYYTGDNYEPDGTYTVHTPLTLLDMDNLTDYINGGGILLAMGQDIAAILGTAETNPSTTTHFYHYILGGNWLQDSVSGGTAAAWPVVPIDNAPEAFGDLLVELGGVGDSAGNQSYVDEIAPAPMASYFVDIPGAEVSWMPLFKYTGLSNVDAGTVAMAHRDQPTLERPGISYLGRSIYTTFGLEGVSDGDGIYSGSTRAELLEELLSWALDETTVAISAGTTQNDSLLTSFTATVTSMIYGGEGTGTLPLDEDAVSYRWDFGDGTEIADSMDSNTVVHQYTTCGRYTVKVESIDIYGNHAVGEYPLTLTGNCEFYPTYLPMVLKSYSPN